ncbi:MAG: NUDIX domain-containing protein [bacterium]|nr:NUDIX domain-containing protein [bacterium]
MAHIHEKIDFVVEVFIVHENKVLLRLHDKYRIWLSIGGHIELDEDPNQAALREVKEEVGLTIQLLDTRSKELVEKSEGELIAPMFLKRHNINADHEHVVMTYFATADSDMIIPESETDQWKWVTKEDLKSMDLKPDIRIYAERALETLGT